MVIEAGKKSGGVITALNALDQSPEVFALPGQADSRKSDGTNRLIQQCSSLVMKVEDILTEFALQLPQKQVEILPKLSSEESAVFIRLSHKLLHIDKLCTQMKKDIPEVISTLLLPELINLDLQHPGKLFTKSV